MTRKDVSDEQIDRILREAENGLSPSEPTLRTDHADAPSVRSSRESPRRRGATNPAPPWLLPASIAVVALLVAGIAVHLLQQNRLGALDDEVAGLRADVERVSGGEFQQTLQQLEARIDGVSARLEVIADREAGTPQPELTAEIEALTQRVGELEEKLSALPEAGTASEDDEPAATGNGPSSETASGGWVVNLISVADPASAGRIERRLNEMNVQLRVDTVESGGRSLKRFVLTGFDSREEARAAAARMKDELELPEEPWIARR